MLSPFPGRMVTCLSRDSSNRFFFRLASRELVNDSTQAIRRMTSTGLRAAVHQNKIFTLGGLSERLFTLAFQGLVYPQIWEDPVVDMEALRIGPEDHVVTIASGGCNVLSYLTADPARITAVDLNGAHIALNQLKLAGLRHLPSHAAFFNFFGRADSPDNIKAYDTYIRSGLDPASRAYWDRRPLGGKRRIEAFAHNFYRHGLLGHFIGASHLLVKAYGRDLGAILKARNLSEQRELFEKHMAPIFEKSFVRWLIKQPATLYGLGIPPSQYKALSSDGPQDITQVLRARVEQLACGFDIKKNYFAWQAFARGYEKAPDASLPPYLAEENFELLRARQNRVTLKHGSMTDMLSQSPQASVDCFVLLDAQDWMNDAVLTALWTEIRRTAKPGARVIFRTAANERLLPGRVPAHILDAFTYDPEACESFGRRDRSSIYGAFHLYTLTTA